ncbi:hypothetical protein JCM8097_008848 [Rhodosporidiobolus ruineniae]
MSTLSPSAADASTRLLRVLASLAAQLDPAKGIKANTLKALAEDVEDIGRDGGLSLSSEVRRLLHSPNFALSGAKNGSVPLTAALSVQLDLVRAIQLIKLSSSSPPPPSALSRLPTELLAGIVQHCQYEDLLLRQRTNLALARTCREFHRAVSPILAVERHLSTPGEIEQVYRGLTADTVRSLQIRHLSIRVPLEDLERREGGRWVGRLVEPLLLALRRQLESFHFQVVPSPRHDFGNLLEALGMTPEDLDWDEVVANGVRGIKDVELPIFGGGFGSHRAVLRSLFNHTETTIVRLGTASLPYWFEAWTVRAELERLGINLALRNPFDVHNGRLQHLQVLSAPYFTFFPTDFLALLRPTSPGTPSALSHLDVAFNLSDDEQVAALDEIFTLLAPSLRRLAVRIRSPHRPDTSSPTITDGLTAALAHCTSLQHLEIGGRGLGADLVPMLLPLVPRLQHLSLLPLLGYFDYEVLADATTRLFPPTLRSFELSPPIPRMGRSFFGWTEKHLRYVAEDCERLGVKLKIETREKEEEWFLRER